MQSSILTSLRSNLSFLSYLNPATLLEQKEYCSSEVSWGMLKVSSPFPCVVERASF